MGSLMRLSAVILLVLATGLFGMACTEKKQGKVEVIEKEFSMVKNGKYSYSINVKGKVRNIGDVDVKQIVVTGTCKSCGEAMISDTWYATQEIKSDSQKDMISYLAAGDTDDFAFNDIAYYYTQKNEEEPETRPETLEVFIESFVTVN